MHLSERRTRLALAAWAIAVACIAAEAVRVHGGALYSIDFEPVYQGALHLRTVGDPYAPVTGISPFVYPPSAALLFLPITLVGSHAASAGGLLLAVASLIALACGSARVAGHSAFGWLAAVTAALLAVTPIGYGTMQVGNLSLLVAAGLAWTLALAVEDRWLAAAVVLAVAVAIKPLIAPAFVIFLLARQWRSTAVAVAVVVVLNLAALPLLHHPTDFVSKVIPNLVRGNTLPLRYNAALSGFGERHHIAGWVVVIGQVAVACACVAVCALAMRSAPHLRWPIIATVATVGTALISAQDEGHYNLVAVPLVVLCLAAPGVRRLARTVGVLTGIMLAFSATVPLVLAGQLAAIVAGAAMTAGQSTSESIRACRYRENSSR